jgi:hypothetical protein
LLQRILFVSRKGRGGEKVKRRIFISTLLLVVAAFTIAPVMAPCGPAVEISKTPFCMTYPGASPGSPGDRYSTNPIGMDNGIPVYPTHTKLFWWIEITVMAHADLTDVVVYDRLGAEFMVEGIYDEGQLPSPGPDPEPALTYAFDYDGKDTEVERITPGQDVSANGATGTVDKGDMFRGTDGGINFGDYRIFWTGNSCKVHFMWTIGDMTAGETAVVYLVISTDLNPAGHQEFTSCGTAFLNSGATVKGFVDGRQVSAEADPIEIKVVND